MAMSIRVDGVDKAVTANGHQSAKTLANRTARACDQLVEHRLQGPRAKSLHKLLHATLAQPYRCDQRAHVTTRSHRKTRVAKEHAQQFLVDTPFAGQARRRHDNALLENLGAQRRDRPCMHTAHIAKMRP